MTNPSAEVFEEFSSESPSPRRPWTATIKRRSLFLLTLFCGICSAVFFTAPLLERSYRVSGSMQVTLPTIAAIPEMDRLPEATLKEPEFAASPQRVQITVAQPASGEPVAVHFAFSAKSSGIAADQIRVIAQFFAARLNHRVGEMIAAYRAAQEKTSADLAKQEADLSKQEQELSPKIEQFKITNHAAMPDDPNSTMSQFEKLVEKMDGKQQRLQIVTQQISRLQDYKKANDANGGHGALPPPQIPGADGSLSPAAAASHPENDPEVLALTAQVQLVNKQIDEQLTTMGRTEQHPYVVDLRKQQADLQKKLAAARERAAAGKPAPADAILTESTTHPADSNLTAVDINLQNLLAEHDALNDEMKTLTTQREALQTKVNDVVRIRQELEKMTASLAGIQRQREALHKQAEEVAGQLRLLPEHPNTAYVEVTPLAFGSNSTLPSFPSLPAVYTLGVAIAAFLTAILALLLHKTDRTLHTPAEVAQVLELPILGTVSEIRSPKLQRRHHLWRVAGRPAVLLALIAFTLFAAVLCYERLIASTTGNSDVLRSTASLTSINP